MRMTVENQILVADHWQTYKLRDRSKFFGFVFSGVALFVGSVHTLELDFVKEKLIHGVVSVIKIPVEDYRIHFLDHRIKLVLYDGTEIECDKFHVLNMRPHYKGRMKYVKSKA